MNSSQHIFPFRVLRMRVPYFFGRLKKDPTFTEVPRKI